MVSPAVPSQRKTHSPSVWARDLRRSLWAWQCNCGVRYEEDLPSIEAARAEAARHCQTANNARTAA